MKESGVVLKNHLPAKHKVSILSDTGERFDAVAVNPKIISTLRPGYRIIYSTISSGYLAKLSDIEIVQIPRAVCFNSLQFLHQVLNLCSLVIPEGQVAVEAATLLRVLNDKNLNNWSKTQQQLFICRILSSLGFFPELNPNQNELIHKVHQVSNLEIDSFLNTKIDTDTKKLLPKWISEFMNEHLSPGVIPLFSTIY